MKQLLRMRNWGARKKPTEPTARDEIPRYPPFFEGMPVARTDELVATQQELIRELYRILSLNEREFDEIVLPVIRNYAAYVHLLPASESHHHRGAGGLLHHGMDVGIRTVRGLRDSHLIESNVAPSAKAKLELRWPVAGFVAGLSHDIGKPVTDVSVADARGHQEWEPFEENLGDWAARHGIRRYFLRWTPGRYCAHGGMNAAMVMRICTQRLLHWLGQPGRSAVEAMMQSITLEHLAPDTNPLKQAVKTADGASVSEDLRRWRIGGTEVGTGVPAEQFLIDALRRLTEAQNWKVNQLGSPFWCLDGTLYIAWAQVAPEIVRVLDQDGIPGISHKPEAMADILLERGLAKPYQPDDQSKQRRYWPVWVVAENRGQKMESRFSALALETPRILFAYNLANTQGGVVDAGKQSRGQDREKTAQEREQTSASVASDQRASGTEPPGVSQKRAGKGEDGASAPPATPTAPPATPVPAAEVANAATPKTPASAQAHVPEVAEENRPGNADGTQERGQVGKTEAARPANTPKPITDSDKETGLRALQEHVGCYLNMGDFLVEAYRALMTYDHLQDWLRWDGDELLLAYPKGVTFGTRAKPENIVSQGVSVGLLMDKRGDPATPQGVEKSGGRLWVRLGNRAKAYFALLLQKPND